MKKAGILKHKGFFRRVHLQAFIFLLLYSVLSKTIFFKALASRNTLIEFLIPYIFGVIAGFVFLYLFNHEDFFHFIREVEHEEKQKENLYLKKYLHFGKIVCTLIIALLGGPLFSALTVRFLLNNVWYRYWLIALGNVGSTILSVSLAKGVLAFVL